MSRACIQNGEWLNECRGYDTKVTERREAEGALLAEDLPQKRSLSRRRSRGWARLGCLYHLEVCSVLNVVHHNTYPNEHHRRTDRSQSVSRNFIAPHPVPRKDCTPFKGREIWKTIQFTEISTTVVFHSTGGLTETRSSGTICIPASTGARALTGSPATTRWAS